MPPSCKPPEKVLKRLGLSEEDVRVSEKLISQIPPAPCSLPTVYTKAERILGYTETRLKRAKALRFLGATEDDVELENAKKFRGSGTGGEAAQLYRGREYRNTCGESSSLLST